MFLFPALQHGQKMVIMVSEESPSKRLSSISSNRNPYIRKQHKKAPKNKKCFLAASACLLISKCRPGHATALQTPLGDRYSLTRGVTVFRAKGHTKKNVPKSSDVTAVASFVHLGRILRHTPQPKKSQRRYPLPPPPNHSAGSLFQSLRGGFERIRYHTLAVSRASQRTTNNSPPPGRRTPPPPSTPSSCWPLRTQEAETRKIIKRNPHSRACHRSRTRAIVETRRRAESCYAPRE